MENVDTDSWESHKESYGRCLAYWRDAALRGADEVSESEAAYDLLAHTGFMLRIGADRNAPPQALSFPMEDRVRIVSAACDHIEQFSLPDNVKRYLANDALENEELGEFEQILLQRDELDVVVQFSREMVRDTIEHDDALLAKLASAVSVAAELDEAILSRPDIIAVASRILVGSRPDPWHSEDPLSDWFVKARAWDLGFSSPNLPDLAGLLRGVQPTPGGNAAPALPSRRTDADQHHIGAERPGFALAAGGDESGDPLID